MKSLKLLSRAFGVMLLGLAAIAPAKAAEDIVVTHYGSLMYGVPYTIALENGYFKEVGLDVDGIMTSKGGGTSIRNMLAGDTLYAEVALTSAIAAINEGFDIKIINGGTDGRSSVWVTRVGEKIETPEDLKGKRFVYSRPKSVSEAMILAVLESHGYTRDDVTMIAIGDFGAGLTALEHNEVDIAIMPEPIFSKKVKAGAAYQMISWLDSKLPLYTGTVGVATSEAIAANEDKIRAVIAARAKAIAFMDSNPDETAEIVAKAYNMDVDTAKSAIGNIKKMTPTWWNPGPLQYDKMDAMAGIMISTGTLAEMPEWKAFIDDRFLAGN
ncbi:ABC transporter substrate-binding protein [Sneathiella sp.]|uniref:ABC transporter substrate-binding protein n=1 Tax=Sneathiella sp. TaxID=1964365 RepID=UPI002FE3E9DF